MHGRSRDVFGEGCQTTCGIYHPDILCSILRKGCFPLPLRKAPPLAQSDSCNDAMLRQQSQALLGAASFGSPSRQLCRLVLRLWG